ncbi:pirin family protein [Maricaulis sp.]|uniref:pirin family protein n=1 Tax=Maricaulis sp. TaxID=1486257 RepID=UPI0025C34E89|nr:pirin family protein [Maricaulis sp.]
MLTIRRSEDRGPSRIGWLDSRHSFSFGQYHDPAHMGFGPLRVINEDRVIGGAGFPTHGHANMEIISYVLDGALEHRDSIGTGSVIRPGDVQRMSAGSGIRHSEFNHSKTEGVHFLQIWILPDADGIAPSYEQKAFDEASKRGQLRLVGSRDARDGSLTLHQDVDLYAGLFDGDERAELPLRDGRAAWVQIARGEVRINDADLRAGDGAAITNEDRIVIDNGRSAEVLVFDMKL